MNARDQPIMLYLLPDRWADPSKSPLTWHAFAPPGGKEPGGSV